MMLLSAPLPVGLSRVGGRRHQSSYLESSKRGNGTLLLFFLMCGANKKDQHQTSKLTGKLVSERPRHCVFF